MILKGSQRSGAMQLAKHLLNAETNEHVTIHQIKGFISDDVTGALNEAYALSKGTQCKQFMFSLSLNPPQNENVPVEVFEDALEKIEEKLGLVNQPRILIFHEKEGRRHAHCVWSRINIEEMKAINLPHYKLKLNSISKQLYLEHNWQLPKGFIDKKHKNPLNFTRDEWQQAIRSGQNPKAIKAALQECWAASDNKKSFEQALSMRGYYLAKGDRRGYVAVDIYGEVYSLTRTLGIKKKGIEARLGKSEKLPSVAKVKDRIKGQISKIFKNFLDEQQKEHIKKLSPLLDIKSAMTKQHRIDRAAQKAWQDKRWHKEELKRVSKIRKGFKGLWDKLTGTYWKQRKTNEKQAWNCYMRDQSERQSLIEKQLIQRQNLQAQLNLVRNKHEKDRQNITRDLSHMVNVKEGKENKLTSIKSPDHQKHKGFDNPDMDMGPEPEI